MFDQRTRARLPLQGCTIADILPVKSSRNPSEKCLSLQSYRHTPCHGLSFGCAGGKVGQRQKKSSMMRNPSFSSQEEYPG